jgi:23S rRNA (adenine1618-N6)-methyltransferase
LYLSIIGNASYGWNFVGTDIDEGSENCTAIIEQNPQLVDAISLQQQTESRFIFKNIILEDRFTLLFAIHHFTNH